MLGLPKAFVAMPTGEPPPIGPAPSIFISYASQDREAARNLRDALGAAGFEVWYDESDLGGGDAWDQKIRRQIRDCTYFMPIISANSDARHEGYFRREWRLAVDRSHDMADDVTFIVPVTVDSTGQARARVPEKFLSVQWLSVPDGRPTPAFDAWCRRLLGGDVAPAAAPRPTKAAAPRAAAARNLEYPHFPEQKAGQKLHFLFLVAGWALRTAWVWYSRLSRGWRRLVIVVLVIFVLAKMCSGNSRAPEPTGEQKAKAQKIISEVGEKFDAASQSKDKKVDLVKLGTDIAAAVNRELGDEAGSEPDILAVPFAAPADDEAAGRFAGTVFASAYGQLSMAAPGKVALAKPGPAGAQGDPLKLARDRGASKVLFGAIQGSGDGLHLEVTLEAADQSTVFWSGSFPLKGADPVGVANDIRAHVYPSN